MRDFAIPEIPQPVIVTAACIAGVSRPPGICIVCIAGFH